MYPFARSPSGVGAGGTAHTICVMSDTKMDMTGFTGMIEVNGVWYVVWDGEYYYFGEEDS